MSSEIRQYIESCDTCATHSDKQAAEPLFMHEVSGRPWQKVSTDLLSFEGRNYLTTVDYYSNFFEIDFLKEMLSEDVITKLKHHFDHQQPRTVPVETVNITPVKSPDKAQSPVVESTDITRLHSSPNLKQPYMAKTGRVMKPVRKLNLWNMLESC